MSTSVLPCGMHGICAILLVVLLGGCGASPWNNPYPSDAGGENIFYSSFPERPKHLDPARSYSANEWAFISQIYEPPLQYHFLKRPYELVPLTATRLPEARYLAADGKELRFEAARSPRVAYTDYLVTIRSGIRYRPHPAFARAADGSYLYWPLTAEQLAAVRTLADFPVVATRELTAADYVY